MRRAASQRMGVMIDDILKLSRLTRTEIRSEPINLRALAQIMQSEIRRKTP